MKDTRNEIRFEIIEHIGILEQRAECCVLEWKSGQIRYTGLVCRSFAHVKGTDAQRAGNEIFDRDDCQ